MGFSCLLYNRYAPASGEIFGILKQMKEDFAKNLSSAQQEEEQARQAFKELKVAKEAQMAAARKQQANFEAELADNLEKKATAEQDLADTEAQLSDDQKFLLNLRQRCKTSDAEYSPMSLSLLSAETPPAPATRYRTCCPQGMRLNCCSAELEEMRLPDSSFFSLVSP